MITTSCRLAMMAATPKLPLEAEPQVEHDADADDEQRQRAVLDELLADLRADELDAPQLAPVLSSALQQRRSPSADSSALRLALAPAAGGSARRARCRSSAPSASVARARRASRGSASDVGGLL